MAKLTEYTFKSKNNITYSVKVEGANTDDTTKDDKVIITATKGNVTQTISIFTGTENTVDGTDYSKYIDGNDTVKFERKDGDFEIDKGVISGIFQLIGGNGALRTIKDLSVLEFDPECNEVWKKALATEGTYSLGSQAPSTLENLAKSIMPAPANNGTNPTMPWQGPFYCPPGKYANGGSMTVSGETTTEKVELTKEQKERLTEYKNKLEEQTKREKDLNARISELESHMPRATGYAQIYQTNPYYKEGYDSCGNGSAIEHLEELKELLAKAKAELASVEKQISTLNEEYKDVKKYATETKTVKQPDITITDPYDPSKTQVTPGTTTTPADNKPKDLDGAKKDGTKELEEANKVVTETQDLINGTDLEKAEDIKRVDKKRIEEDADYIKKVGTVAMADEAMRIAKTHYNPETKIYAHDDKDKGNEAVKMLNNANLAKTAAQEALDEITSAQTDLNNAAEKLNNAKNPDEAIAALENIKKAKEKAKAALKKATDAKNAAKEALIAMKGIGEYKEPTGDGKTTTPDNPDGKPTGDNGTTTDNPAGENTGGTGVKTTKNDKKYVLQK